MKLRYPPKRSAKPDQFLIAKRSDETPLFLHELNQLNDPSARILDLGAGKGSFPYGNYRSRIFAVDINRATSWSPTTGADPIIADASALPFNSQAFDLVVANFAFEHFISPDTALREIQRILKAESLLYLSVPNGACWEDRLFRWLGGGKDHVQSYSFHSLLKLIYQNTSLKLISFADWPPGFTYLANASGGSIPRRIVLRSLKILRPLMQKHSRKDSGFILLLAKGSNSGFRSVTHTCAYCGSGATIGAPLPDSWQCPQCMRTNALL